MLTTTLTRLDHGGVSRRGGEVGRSSVAWMEACVSASCSGATSATEAFESGVSPADSNGVEALGGFSTKSGAALSSAGGSATAILFLLQISPSSVVSFVSSSDTTLGAFLLAFLRGSFLCWGLEERRLRVDRLAETGLGRRRSPQQNSELFGSPPPACGA